jgi:hypothetical protein
MHPMQNKKNKDQFNIRKRKINREGEGKFFVRALLAPWSGDLTGPPTIAVHIENQMTDKTGTD